MKQYVAIIKRYLDSLTNEAYAEETRNNPHLNDLLKAINYRRSDGKDQSEIGR